MAVGEQGHGVGPAVVACGGTRAGVAEPDDHPVDGQLLGVADGASSAGASAAGASSAASPSTPSASSPSSASSTSPRSATWTGAVTIASSGSMSVVTASRARSPTRMASPICISLMSTAISLGMSAGLAEMARW